jgi:crotonobetainyl-CoA:carnitine CoA-transferase CaiB-like acyl-CoA transferase
MVKSADVVMENFRAGYMKELGLDYDVLRKINPKLIFCSLTAYGQNAPKGHHTAYDGIVQAASGMMSVTGTKETGPLKVGPVIPRLRLGPRRRLCHHAVAAAPGQDWRRPVH